MEYNFRDIEKKRQKYWADNKTFRADNISSPHRGEVGRGAQKPKYYVLDMFPYPSGAGLHVGHPLGYIASDIYSRFKRLMGFNVLHPMGYDSFGLPAEQYAIQTGQHPAKTTEENINRYREQLDKLGFSFDWDREVRTSDPDYYKWTQWIFLKLFNAWYNPETDRTEHIDTLVNKLQVAGCRLETEGVEKKWDELNEKEKSDVLMNYRIAYLSDAYVWWCQALGSVLANDEVKEGVSERGGYPVERRLMKQWSMRITAYADRLLSGLDTIDWPESLKEAQRNWIGRSEGTSLKFSLTPDPSPKERGDEFEIEVFTTRPDTIFGVSFLTLAPEHELVEKITTTAQKQKVQAYLEYAKSRSERDRMADVKKVTGEFTGAFAAHPFTGKNIPIWVGDYVLAGYGTGAVMGVPGHDERDHRFAKHFDLPIIQVVEKANSPSLQERGLGGEAYEAKEGKMMNSDFINGLEVKNAIKKTIAEIEKRGLGKGKINYRLRDAVFGRQRYWGEPIPIYYKDGIPYPVDEEDLPVILPEVDKYLPTESGEPPLARAKNWTYTASPQPSPKEREQEDPGYHTSDKNIWNILKENSRKNRKKSTKAEELLWNELRNGKTGFKIRRQHAVYSYIADFICLEKGLIIEADGEIHDSEENSKKDNIRTEILESKGYKVIRFKNHEIENNLPAVIQKIKDELISPLLRRGAGGEAYPLETTTMPGWAGSSWYFLRYMDANNEDEFASRAATDYWKDVDLYIGGTEHATGHLLYVRFWTKALKDLGYISADEPAKKLINQGMIQGESQFVYYFDLSDKTEFKYKEGAMYLVENIKCRNSEVDSLLETFCKSGEFLIKSKDLKRVFVSAELVENEIGLNKTHAKIEDVSLNVLDKIKFQEFHSPKFGEVIFIQKGGYHMDGVEYSIPIDAKNEMIFKTKSEIEKMSKSKYNIVNPDDMCEQYGADTFRMYEMFLGPLEQSKPWNTNGITGVHNFLKKFWRLFHSPEWNVTSPLLWRGAGGEALSEDPPSKAELKILHKTIRKAKEDIERFSFNTSVSLFMICVNELTDLKCNKRSILEPLTILISPYAPHIAEELWEKMGHKKSISFAKYPEYKEEYTLEDSFAYPVSFNGKMRFNLELPLNLSKEDIEKEVMACEQTHKYLEGKSPKKVIVVPKKIVNIVV